MATDKPLICVRKNGVNLMPGNATTAIRGLNTRFGKYASGPLSGAACKAAYPPDLNVRTGWKPKATGKSARLVRGRAGRNGDGRQPKLAARES